MTFKSFNDIFLKFLKIVTSLETCIILQIYHQSIRNCYKNDPHIIIHVTYESFFKYLTLNNAEFVIFHF